MLAYGHTFAVGTKNAAVLYGIRGIVFSEKCNLKGSLIVGGPETGFKKFAVESGDVGDGDLLRAFGFTLGLIAAISESLVVHFPNHGNGTLGGFRSSLG